MRLAFALNCRSAQLLAACRMYNSTASIEHIESRFPAISDDLHEEGIGGLLHTQMSIFSRMAQDAIDCKDEKLWHEVTATFLQIWGNCTPEVTNALNVSFLEHLLFTDGKKVRSWAYRDMPTTMQRAWDDMDEYNRNLHGG